MNGTEVFDLQSASPLIDDSSNYNNGVLVISAVLVRVRLIEIDEG